MRRAEKAVGSRRGPGDLGHERPGVYVRVYVCLRARVSSASQHTREVGTYSLMHLSVVSVCVPRGRGCESLCGRGEQLGASMAHLPRR